MTNSPQRTTQRPLIYWFRQDLRLADLPGLHAAADSGREIVACYVHDTHSPGQWAPGGASRWWLHHSLAQLQGALAALGGSLVLRQGNAAKELCDLAHQCDADTIVCTGAHESWAIAQETALQEQSAAQELAFRTYPGALLFEPRQVATGAGGPFKVFTPFWKACRRLPEPAPPLPAPERLKFFAGPVTTLDLPALSLLPSAPNWAAHWHEYWQPGEQGANAALGRFLSESLGDYSEGRDHPGRQSTSRLSAHLHFGELSPRQLWHRARYQQDRQPQSGAQVDKFLSELGWREFSRHLLFHFPDIPQQPFKPAFSKFPWADRPQALKSWQQGMTGYPIVDAGMRELWHSGYMHNRVRMIVASFLTKHLLLDWRCGQQWFWDTLVDADLANNACSWQWVAGSGADASPYFRIFNPTLQGQKFDADGDYVRQWVPELAALPNKYIHQPHVAPAPVLEQAGVVLGETYPGPIVDHKYARETALAAYASIRS